MFNREDAKSAKKEKELERMYLNHADFAVLRVFAVKEVWQ
jgi:hypothetical protein